MFCLAANCYRLGFVLIVLKKARIRPYRYGYCQKGITKALIAATYLIINLYYFDVDITTTIDTGGLGGSRGARGSTI